MTHVQVNKLVPGQLIAWEDEKIGPYAVRVPMRVVDVRLKPEIDRTEQELLYPKYPPHYLQIEDPRTGKRCHYTIPGLWTGFEVIADHHPVCSSCGALWPCREHVLDNYVRDESRRLGRSCVVCGKDDGWRIADVKSDTPDGVVVERFHTRKGTKCRTAYLKAIEGDEGALTRLRKEDLAYAVQADRTRGRRGRR